MGYVYYKNRIKSIFLTARIISSQSKSNLLPDGFTCNSTITKATNKQSESIFIKLVNQIGLPKIRKYLVPPNI